MSSAALQGGASGTGVVTLLAPSTSTNRTLTLPDVTGTLLTNTSLTTTSTLASITTTGGVDIIGTNTNDAAATGYIGEYVSSTGTNVNATGSGNYFDVASITLTAGDWDVVALGQLTIAGATMAGACLFAIGTVSGNSATGVVAGDTSLEFLQPTGSTNSGASIPMKRYSLASTTTLYFKGYATYSAGTPQATGRISARRVR
jgi:hypothetical protein